MEQTSSAPTQKIVVVGAQKSTAVAILLAFFFGPLGLLYSTTAGAITMFFVNLVLFFILPVVGLIFGWIGCVIWAIIAVSQTNAQFRKATS
jgi:hypothetical protein